MKLNAVLLVVENLEKSRKFYQDVLGLEVVMDFGQNITLTGNLALQTKQSWVALIDKTDKEIGYQGNDGEIYFEEVDFEQFLNKLQKMKNISYLHPVKQHPWGQRVVRFYDPDRHIIEVGEAMENVCQRFLQQGLSVAETAAITQYPLGFIENMRKSFN